jgi:hypothetical protein
LDVFLSVLRMTGEAHCTELVVSPDRAEAPAKGAVAARGLLRSRWQFDRDSATVAGSYQHDVLSDVSNRATGSLHDA